MKRRMNNLWTELELTGTAFEPDAGQVLRRVNQALDAEPSERKCYMKWKLRRAVLAVAAAVLLMSSALAAASQWDALSVFFTGDTTPNQQYVQSPDLSVGDDRFTVTLSSCASDQRTLFLLMTVTALTEDARTEFSQFGLEARNLFDYKMLVSPAEDTPVAYGSTWDELEELRTPDSRSYRLLLDLHPKAIRAWLTFSFLPEEMTMELPLDRTVGAVELKAELDATDSAGRPYRFLGATISPLTFQFRYQIPQTSEIRLSTVYCFLMDDDTILSASQMLNNRGANLERISSNGIELIYVENARFREIQDITKLRAVIIGGTAFPLDGGEPYEIDVDPTLSPFRIPLIPGVMQGGPFVVPAEELCKRLGAAYTWDEETQRALLTYRDVTVALTLGSKTMLVDGAEITLEYPPVLREGQLYLDPAPLFEPWLLSARLYSHKVHTIPTAWEITP